MGKAKKRGFSLKGKEFKPMTRDEAIKQVVHILEADLDEAKNLITLFGLTAEELLEGGATYEAVKTVDKLIG